MGFSFISLTFSNSSGSLSFDSWYMERLGYRTSYLLYGLRLLTSGGGGIGIPFSSTLIPCFSIKWLIFLLFLYSPFSTVCFAFKFRLRTILRYCLLDCASFRRSWRAASWSATAWSATSLWSCTLRDISEDPTRLCCTCCFSLLYFSPLLFCALLRLVWFNKKLFISGVLTPNSLALLSILPVVCANYSTG